MWLGLAALLAYAVWMAAGGRESPAEDPAENPVKAPGVGDAAAPRASHELPASDRVFMLERADGTPVLLGADGEQLWASAVDPLPPRALWRRSGSGAVHQATAGDHGSGHRFYVVRGSVGRIRAPLQLIELDPDSGEERELWRSDGPRNEAVHLSIADRDGDGEPELALAHFVSQHEVRPLHLERDGEVHEGPTLRMATTRAWADVDGDGAADEIIGRVYGDQSDLAGHIRVRLGDRWEHVSTDRGVRSLAVVSEPEEGVSIYFADGWSASYGKEGRARLKRARFSEGRFAVEPLATMDGEYTLFSLAPFRIAGRRAVAAAGSHRVTVAVEPESRTGPWSTSVVAEAREPQSVAALSSEDGCAWVVIPGQPTRMEQVCL